MPRTPGATPTPARRRRALALALALALGPIAAAAATRRPVDPRPRQFERALSGSGDITYDDDFWAYDAGSTAVAWDDYALSPTTCLVYQDRHVVAFSLFGKGHKGCAKKREGTYLMDAGPFARAYVAQQQVDYALAGNDYGAPEALDYLDCTAVEYNDAYYYAKLGCSSMGGLKVVSYADDACTQEVSTNIGLYNDIKIQFNVCRACVAWPAAATDDDAVADVEVDDNFAAYHAYDSKLCGAAAEYGDTCGWGCRKRVKQALKSSDGGGGTSNKRAWGGFERFCLCVLSLAAVGLVWTVLKQRRRMTREDAIVEEAAMHGVGLKKRHVFPLGLGIVAGVLLSMFLVWKRATWLLLLGANLGLGAHLVFLRRKAQRAGGGGAGYVKDAGLEIS